MRTPWLKPPIAILLLTLFASVTSAQETTWWEVQNPKPYAGNLFDVAMLDENTFIAVGEYGLILKTTNDGLDWQSQSPTTRTLYAIAFSSDKQHGIVLTNTEAIYFTTDAGNTWDTTQQPTVNPLKDACFRTATDVYAVGVFGTIVHSTDAGRTWTRTANELDDNLLSIHFADEQHGYIAANYGIYYVTDDGGTSWSRKEFPFGNSLYAIYGADAAHIIAGGEAGGVFLSNDSGKTWQQQELRSPRTMYGVTRLSKDVALACGLYSSIYKTTDAGTTWQYVSPNVRSDALKAFSFASPLQGVCVGGKSNRAAILRTTDGGSSWYRLTTNVADDEMLRDIHCIDTMTAVAVGTVILRTSDRGMHWQRMPKPTYKDLYAVDFPTRTVGYAVGDSGYVLKTTDEGLSWSKLQTPFTCNLIAVDFLNADTGIAVSSDNKGFIVQTWDGGYSWKVGIAPKQLIMKGVAYASSSTILIASYDRLDMTAIEPGICLRSTDGGWNWSLIYNNIPKTAQCISFADPLHGFIGGQAISTTSDGGITWTSFPLGTTNNFKIINGISAVDRLRATAVGTGSYHTTDGGVTWKGIGANTLYAIHHPSVETATAVGRTASILRLTTSDKPLAHVNPLPSAPEKLKLSIYPNPASIRTTINFTLESSDFIALDIYTPEGKLTRQLYRGLVASGEQSLEADLSGLASGSYFLAITSSSGKEYHRIVIEK